MQTYLDLIQTILDKGEDKGDRTGTGTKSVFGHQMRFDLSEGFPMVTTKKLHLKSIVYELLWFLKGDTNVKYLQENGVRIWNEWADDNGNLGPVYGKQWRQWEAKDGSVIDQVSEAVEMIKNNPNSRRIIVSAWNVGELNEMALMPCHALFQFHVANGKLNCQLYQRSADVFLGVPFNIDCVVAILFEMSKIRGNVSAPFVSSSMYLRTWKSRKIKVDLAISKCSRASGIRLKYVIVYRLMEMESCS